MPFKDKEKRRAYHREYARKTGWYKKRYQSRTRGGLCKDCGIKNREKGVTRCKVCIFKHLAQRYLGTNQRYSELQELFEQQKGCCAYSGRALHLPGTASIEHVIPRSSRKCTNISNIKWVDIEINKMKSNLPLHKFLMNCKEVLLWFGYKISSV